jgi:hypothetical protein
MRHLARRPAPSAAAAVRVAARQLLHYCIQQCLLGQNFVQPPERRLDQSLDQLFN